MIKVYYVKKLVKRMNRMKKFSTKLLAAVVTSSLIVTPVMAAPSTESIEPVSYTHLYRF